MIGFGCDWDVYFIPQGRKEAGLLGELPKRGMYVELCMVVVVDEAASMSDWAPLSAMYIYVAIVATACL